METTEKRFESDIESALLSPAGGYTKGITFEKNTRKKGKSMVP